MIPFFIFLNNHCLPASKCCHYSIYPPKCHYNLSLLGRHIFQICSIMTSHVRVLSFKYVKSLFHHFLLHSDVSYKPRFSNSIFPLCCHYLYKLDVRWGFHLTAIMCVLLERTGCASATSSRSNMRLWRNIKITSRRSSLEEEDLMEEFNSRCKPPPSPSPDTITLSSSPLTCTLLSASQALFTACYTTGVCAMCYQAS